MQQSMQQNQLLPKCSPSQTFAPGTGTHSKHKSRLDLEEEEKEATLERYEALGTEASQRVLEQGGGSRAGDY